MNFECANSEEEALIHENFNMLLYYLCNVCLTIIPLLTEATKARIVLSGACLGLDEDLG